MRTFDDIIGVIGTAKLAEVLGLAESHARVMKARHSIPPEYWGVLIQQAPALGIADLTIDELLEARAALRRGPSDMGQSPTPTTEAAA